LLTVINEKFLHYLWKHKLFNQNNIATTKNEKVEVLHVGLHNDDSGPDFFNSKIKIGNQLWAGNVELHLKSSDWYNHNHQIDRSYDSVILHVVWEYDAPVYNNFNTLIPTVQLKKYVNKKILKNYFELFLSTKLILNCENKINKVEELVLINWKDRLYFERLEEKSKFIFQLLKESNYDWEAVLFKMLARNFGLKVNGEAFLQMTNSVDFSVVRKLQNNLFQLEALLFGQSLLLENNIDDLYFDKMKKEYLFLKSKFLLKDTVQPEMKFFRLRPNNFPTIRLSQLANLYSNHSSLFSKIMQVNNLKDYYKLFNITASEFWDTHYTFESNSKYRKKKLTKSFIDLLLINTIIPIKVAYKKRKGIFSQNEIIILLNELKPEKNHITETFKKLKMSVNNAMDSQAFIQLKKNYCNKKRCLDCVIGNYLITTNHK
jgi:hypothetical protein